MYILIPLALIAIVAIRLRTNLKTAQEKVYVYDKEAPVPVKADSVRLLAYVGNISFPGVFSASRESRLSAEMPGRIVRFDADVGDYVSRGQTLVETDKELLSLQLREMDIQIGGLEADVTRYTVLAGHDAVQGIQLEKAVLALESARQKRETILEQLRKTEIRAPYSGFVTARFGELGEYAAPGMPLVQLTDIASLTFTVNVTERDLPRFAESREFTLTADALPGLILTASKATAGHKANPGNSFPVEFKVTNSPEYQIKAGMFGKVSLTDDTTKTGIVIPVGAVTGESGSPRVYVIENGRAVLREIEISTLSEDKAVVSSGLSEGDVLITAGLINLFDGARVTIP